MNNAMKKLLHKMDFQRAKRWFTMFSLIVLVFLFQGCKKDEFSFTKRYEGDWYFQLYEFYNPLADSVNPDLTEQYDGHIFDADENWLYFHLNRDHYVKLKIDETGKIIEGWHPFYQGVPVGGFSDKKHFSYRIYEYDQRDHLDRIVKVIAEPR